MKVCTCKYCKSPILLSRDEQAQVDEGWMDAPDICEDCAEHTDYFMPDEDDLRTPDKD